MPAISPPSLGPLVAALFIAALSLAEPSAAQAQSQCLGYGGGEVIGELTALPESSGLAASHINPDLLWSHNDSGDGPTVYAARMDGTIAMAVTLSGASSVDWEDMDLGPCPEGCACLFMGDIGDNSEVRGGGTIYRVIEPLISESAEGAAATIPIDRALTFVYPDGPHNAETLLVDPLTGIPYIVTKEQDGHAALFRFPDADPATLPATLIKVGDWYFIRNGPLGRVTTGGSISADGARVVVRTYKEAWEWWIGRSDVDDVFDLPPLHITLPRRMQGEAITFSADGQHLLTTTEGGQGRMDALPCTSGEPLLTPAPALTTTCANAATLP